MDLITKKCVPCEGGTPPLTKDEAEKYLKEVPDWEEDPKYKRVRRRFKFADFKEAMVFVNEVAELAEREEHHPDIHIAYNRVEIVLTTHAIDGLSENDFIVAAKIDQLPK